MTARWIFILVVFTLVGACTSEPQKEPQKEEVVRPTLTFWHFWSEPNQKKALVSVVKQFEEQYQCTVELTDLSWNDGKTKLFAAFNAKTAPDVIELGSDWVAQFSYAGVLRNLSADGLDLQRYAAFTHSPAMYNGDVYAVPWVTDTRALYYNKDVLRRAGLPDTAPATLPDMLTAAEEIQQIDGLVGFAANGDDRHRLYKKILPFYWSNGGRALDDNGRPVINSAQNIEALESYLSLARAGEFGTQRELDSKFAKGVVGFWISGAWLLNKLGGESAPDFGVALIPPPPGKQSSSFAGGEYLALNAAPQHPELALAFVRFMTEGSNALKFCKQVNAAGFPADTAYLNDPYFETVPFRTVFAQQLAFARMTPVHPQWLDIEEIIEASVVEALYGRKSAKEALDVAQTELEELLLRPL